MNKLLIIALTFLVFTSTVVGEVDLLGLTLDVKESGVNLDSGNLTVEIWDDPTGGNLLYNSSESYPQQQVDWINKKCKRHQLWKL